MAFNFQISGADKLLNKLQGLPKEMVQRIDGEVKKTVLEINNEQVRRAPIDRSEIRQNTSFSKEATGKDRIDYTLFSNAPHAVFLEFGTRKKFKAIPGVEAPKYTKGDGTAEQALEAIKAWVKRKNIRIESAAKYKSGKRAGQNKMLTQEETAHLIFHYIMLNGIKPQPFFFAPFLEKKDKLVENVASVIKTL